MDGGFTFLLMDKMDTRGQFLYRLFEMRGYPINPFEALNILGMGEWGGPVLVILVEKIIHLCGQQAVHKSGKIFSHDKKGDPGVEDYEQRDGYQDRGDDPETDALVKFHFPVSFSLKPMP